MMKLKSFVKVAPVPRAPHTSMMDRRSFLHFLQRTAVTAAATQLLDDSAFGASAASENFPSAFEPKRPQIALTMDDPRVDVSPQMDWHETNERILGTLAGRKVKAALFVCGMRVDQPDGRSLLGPWDDAGHLICNHSYSHLTYLKKTSFEEYAADFLRNEPIIAPYRHRTAFFRYPSLKEGDTADKRDRFRAFLKERGYRVGHVTIDGSDWYVDQRMEQRLQQDGKAGLEPYRDYLVAHLLDRGSFYRRLALDVLGREIRHTLLVHYSAMNALFLQDVMAAFEKSGWTWIDAERAYEDPVFLKEPQTVPAGESLVWALASESRRFKERLRWPGEDDVYEKPKMDALGL
jgi:peptidoglycan/xylan/chitin deacetylase (PgdA/CDA1 family)